MRLNSYYTTGMIGIYVIGGVLVDVVSVVAVCFSLYFMPIPSFKRSRKQWLPKGRDRVLCENFMYNKIDLFSTFDPSLECGPHCLQRGSALCHIEISILTLGSVKVFLLILSSVPFRSFRSASIFKLVNMMSERKVISSSYRCPHLLKPR